MRLLLRVQLLQQLGRTEAQPDGARGLVEGDDVVLDLVAPQQLVTLLPTEAVEDCDELEDAVRAHVAEPREGLVESQHRQRRELVHLGWRRLGGRLAPWRSRWRYGGGVRGRAAPERQ